MKKKLKLYSLEILFSIILFIALIVSNKISYVFLAFILLVYAIVVNYIIRKRKIISTFSKQVNWLLIGFALIYLGIFYLLGFFVYDFYNAPITFSLKSLFRYMIPLIVIIFSTETIRFNFLSQDSYIIIGKRKIDLCKIIMFIDTVIIDLIIYTGSYDLSNFDDFLTVIGFILFASVSCNLLYNYISIRYGKNGIIGYRLITILYMYLIPIIPSIYIYFRSFLRMIYPYLLYLILEKTYSKTNFVVSYNEKRKNFIGITGLFVIMTLITMLVSCQFKYGLLVIGSESMTGSIEMGDAVLFEKYDNQKIEKGQVIIFNKDNIKVVHRVVDITNVNGQIRYYTKGDANEENDSGYVIDEDIFGVTKIRLMYIGYPTLWFRELFS